jgi:hypothetical protein
VHWREEQRIATVGSSWTQRQIYNRLPELEQWCIINNIIVIVTIDNDEKYAKNGKFPKRIPKK